MHGDVRCACAGHMIASVWDGTRVRRRNKERLQRYRSASIAGCSSHVPQHDWAEHVLDACKYEELLAAASAGSSDSGSSSDHWSDSDSSSEEQATPVDAAATHRDWGTKYAGVDTLLRRAVVPPGELRGQGLQCRWCSHVPVQGESCYATSGSGQVRGVVARLGCASARLLNRNFVSNLPMVADRHVASLSTGTDLAPTGTAGVQSFIESKNRIVFPYGCRPAPVCNHRQIRYEISIQKPYTRG